VRNTPVYAYCADAGPVSALLQHLRDQEQLSTQPLEQQTGCSTAASRAASGSIGGALEGAVSLRGSGLTSVPEGVWQVRWTRIYIHVRPQAHKFSSSEAVMFCKKRQAQAPASKCRAGPTTAETSSCEYACT
jgi:hypothetical protein